ncbi:MAG: hypothetical protein AABX17_01400 [Nanoarchaeota archaeon]
MEKDEPRLFPVQVVTKRTYQGNDTFSFLYHLQESERFPLIVSPEGDILISPNERADTLKEGEVPLTREAAREIARQSKGIAFNDSGQAGFEYSDFVTALKLVSIHRNLSQRNNNSGLLKRVEAGTAFTQLESNLPSFKHVEIMKDEGIFGYVEKPHDCNVGGLPMGTLRFSPNFGLHDLDFNEAKLSTELYLFDLAKKDIPVFLEALTPYLTKNAMRLSADSKTAEGREIKDPTTFNLSYSTPWVALDGKYHTSPYLSGLRAYCIGSEGSPHYSLGEGLKSLPEMLPRFLDVCKNVNAAAKKVKAARSEKDKAKVQRMMDLIGVLE